MRPSRHLVPERHRRLDLGLPSGDVITKSEIFHRQRFPERRQAKRRRRRRLRPTLSTRHPRRLKIFFSAGTHEGSDGKTFLSDSEFCIFKAHEKQTKI